MSQKIDFSREPGEISDLLGFVAEGNNLSVSQAENVFDAFMNERAS